MQKGKGITNRVLPEVCHQKMLQSKASWCAEGYTISIHPSSTGQLDLQQKRTQRTPAGLGHISQTVVLLSDTRWIFSMDFCPFWCVAAKGAFLPLAKPKFPENIPHLIFLFRDSGKEARGAQTGSSYWNQLVWDLAECSRAMTCPTKTLSIEETVKCSILTAKTYLVGSQLWFGFCALCHHPTRQVQLPPLPSVASTSL